MTIREVHTPFLEEVVNKFALEETQKPAIRNALSDYVLYECEGGLFATVWNLAGSANSSSYWDNAMRVLVDKVRQVYTDYFNILEASPESSKKAEALTAFVIKLVLNRELSMRNKNFKWITAQEWREQGLATVGINEVIERAINGNGFKMPPHEMIDVISLLKVEKSRLSVKIASVALTEFIIRHFMLPSDKPNSLMKASVMESIFIEKVDMSGSINMDGVIDKVLNGKDARVPKESIDELSAILKVNRAELKKYLQDVKALLRCPTWGEDPEILLGVTGLILNEIKQMNMEFRDYVGNYEWIEHVEANTSEAGVKDMLDHLRRLRDKKDEFFTAAQNSVGALVRIQNPHEFQVNLIRLLRFGVMRFDRVLGKFHKFLIDHPHSTCAKVDESMLEESFNAEEARQQKHHFEDLYRSYRWVGNRDAETNKSYAAYDLPFKLRDLFMNIDKCKKLLDQYSIQVKIDDRAEVISR